MNFNPIAIAITWLLSFASITQAQVKTGDPDPLAANLAAPDSIIEHAEPSADGAAIDPEALRREVEAMRVQDVAWRKIEWKTCLLDGIRASREQHKPMILWVFIDRPVDDKRC